MPSKNMGVISVTQNGFNVEIRVQDVISQSKFEVFQDTFIDMDNNNLFHFAELHCR